MEYTIGELAKELNVAPSTLRYYEKEELLTSIKWTESGIRVFVDNDFETLKVIECLKARGMSIKDIRKFMDLVKQGNPTIPDRKELFENLKDDYETKLKESYEVLQVIKCKCWFYQKATELGSVEKTEQLSDDELPIEFIDIRNKLKNK